MNSRGYAHGMTANRTADMIDNYKSVFGEDRERLRI